MDICIDSQDPLIFHASDVRVRQSMDIAMRLGVHAVIFHTNHIANFRLKSYREDWLKKNSAYWRRLLAEYPALTVYLENMFDEEPDLLRRLAEDYGADGIIYESMKFCEFWSYEKVLASHVLQQEMGVPCCTIEKEYTLGSVGQLRTRFQAFVESLEIKKLGHKEV